MCALCYTDLRVELIFIFPLDIACMNKVTIVNPSQSLVGRICHSEPVSSNIFYFINFSNQDK